jgi:hypothetical protein
MDSPARRPIVGALGEGFDGIGDCVFDVAAVIPHHRMKGWPFESDVPQVMAVCRQR